MVRDGQKLLIAVCGVLVLVGGRAAAEAETLADAISMAYESNPALVGQRAQQRGLDETYVQARTALRPTASATASMEYQREDFGASGGSTTTPSGAFVLSPGAGRIEANAGTAQITLNQSLYTGGRTIAGIRSAEASVFAGREALRLEEANVLGQVVQAYADVRRDQEIVGIRRENLAVLESQKEETDAKFEAGQVTRTDTAQAAAQLAASRALLTSAQSQLEISRAAYRAVVGQTPGDLAPEPDLPNLPRSVDEAFDVAEAESPAVRQAVLTEKSSREKVTAARAAYRPTVALQGTVGYLGPLSPLNVRDYDRAITAMATVTQPIFTGGLNASNIRAALEQNNVDRAGIEAARRQAVQTVSQAWSAMTAAHANRGSQEEQVRAARTAFEGSQAEYRAGLRTTLDVLIAESTLRDAELSLVQARHDEYVQQAQLLAAVGRLEARRLVRGIDIYDPGASFNQVRRRGAVPWEGLVAGIDGLGAPADRPAPTPNRAPSATPADGPRPTMIAPDSVVPTAGAGG
jgi:outer membrane protein